MTAWRAISTVLFILLFAQDAIGVKVAPSVPVEDELSSSDKETDTTGRRVKYIDFTELLRTRTPLTTAASEGSRYSPYNRNNPTEAPTPIPVLPKDDGSRYSPYNRNNPTEAPTSPPTLAPVVTIAPAPTPPPNWVGPTIGDAGDTSCYRKTYATNTASACPQGYANEEGACVAQCPLSYPVECAAECILQNDDCALAVLNKISAVFSVAINAATSGVFGSILTTFNAIKRGVSCAASLFAVSGELIKYTRYQQTFSNGTVDELLAVAYSSNVFLVELPVAICNCLGIPVPANAKFANTVITIAENIAKQVITNGDTIMSSADNFLNFLSTSETGDSTKELDPASITNLTSLIESGSTCGYQLKRLTDQVTAAVSDIRAKTPDITKEDLRTNMMSSPLVLNDVPTVTNNCLGELLTTKTREAAYESRDVLRKSFGVIIDQLIETSTTDFGASLTADEYMLKVSNMGLVVLAAVDPTGIAYMTSQFVQPICGPTEFLGEIDDGTLVEALGLTTVDDAFRGSYGSWTKTGDGVVLLKFESSDTEDVKVVVHSGGDSIAEVKVEAGGMATWTSTVAELQDKTMYLDRWRPGFLGIPGSGGGSLLLWIPRSSAGGHLEMTVKINVS